MPISTENTSTKPHAGAGALFRAHSHRTRHFHQLRRQGNNHCYMVLPGIRNHSTQPPLRQHQSYNGLFAFDAYAPEAEQGVRAVNPVDKPLPPCNNSRFAPNIALGAAPGAEIISFTVTESGYCPDDAGHPDVFRPALKADLHDEGEINTLHGTPTPARNARANKERQAAKRTCFLFNPQHRNAALPFNQSDTQHHIFTADNPLSVFVDRSTLFGMVRRQDKSQTTSHELPKGK